MIDPFAGYGTTLAAAADLGRAAVGVEYERARADVARDRAPDARVVHGDALELPALDLDADPPFDCCLTSPPYVVAQDERNPYENYAGSSTYEAYLADTRRAFAAVGDLLVADAPVLVDVSNLKHEDRVTTLAWDVADELRTLFRFEGEVVVGWERDDDVDREHGAGAYGYGYDHSYCLVFRA